MEVLQETPMRSTGEDTWTATPEAVERRPLRPMPSSHKKRQASEDSSATKRSRVDDDHAMVKPHDIEARIRMIFPKDDVIGKVSALPHRIDDQYAVADLKLTAFITSHACRLVYLLVSP
jgi:hypothetical protein